MKLFQYHTNQLNSPLFYRWESSTLILDRNSFFSNKNTADYFTWATLARTSAANLVGQLNVSATLNLSIEGRNPIEEQFLQYNENGKLIYSLNVSVLINRVITRVYRMSDKETEDWMGEQITLQYKWSIIVQSIVCFKGLGKISLDIDQTGVSLYREQWIAALWWENIRSEKS